MNFSKSISSLTSWSSSLSAWSDQQQQPQLDHPSGQLFPSFIPNKNDQLEQQRQMEENQLLIQKQQHQQQSLMMMAHLPFQFKRPITGLRSNHQSLSNKNWNSSAHLFGLNVAAVSSRRQAIGQTPCQLTTAPSMFTVYSRKVFIGGLPPDIDESKQFIIGVFLH
jgi:hypothetical protein